MYEDYYAYEGGRGGGTRIAPVDPPERRKIIVSSHQTPSRNKLKYYPDPSAKDSYLQQKIKARKAVEPDGHLDDVVAHYGLEGLQITSTSKFGGGVGSNSSLPGSTMMSALTMESEEWSYQSQEQSQTQEGTKIGPVTYQNRYGYLLASSKHLYFYLANGSMAKQWAWEKLDQVTTTSETSDRSIHILTIYHAGGHKDPLIFEFQDSQILMTAKYEFRSHIQKAKSAPLRDAAVAILTATPNNYATTTAKGRRVGDSSTTTATATNCRRSSSGNTVTSNFTTEEEEQDLLKDQSIISDLSLEMINMKKELASLKNVKKELSALKLVVARTSQMNNNLRQDSLLVKHNNKVQSNQFVTTQRKETPHHLHHHHQLQPPGLTSPYGDLEDDVPGYNNNNSREFGGLLANDMYSYRPPNSNNNNIQGTEWHAPFGESIFTLLYMHSSFQSQAFWYSLCVYAIQVSIITLTLVDIIDLESKDNPLQLPPMVDWAVTCSQAVALFVLLPFSSDLIDSLLKLQDGFYPEVLKEHPGATFAPWLFSCLSQMILGLLVLAASFILTMSASSVVEVTLNLTALLFMTGIDDLGFMMAKSGFITNQLQEEAQSVVGFKVPKRKRTNLYRRALYFLSLVGLFLGYGLIKHRQIAGYTLDNPECNEETCQGTCSAEGLCQCPSHLFGLDCEFSDICNELVVDPTFEPFPAETMSIGFTVSDEFHILKNPTTDEAVRVYNMPVFYANKTHPANIIFYGGRRWILTSEWGLFGNLTEARIEDPDQWFFPEKTVETLENYFFISSPMDFATPDFRPTPVGLQWWTVEQGNGTDSREYQPGLPVDTVLKCKTSCNGKPKGYCGEGAGVCDETTGLCKCDGSRSGDRCEIDGSCVEQAWPCLGRGICDISTGSCQQCHLPYHGKFCENVFKCNEEGGSCKNGGVCNMITGECDCGGDPAVSGRACEKVANCLWYGCANGGQCSANGRCICRPPYYGAHCDLVDTTQEEFFCFADKDCVNGTCNAVTGICACENPSRYGTLCQHRFNCARRSGEGPPCLNDGICNAETGICDCPSGYFGPDCSQVRPCFPGECDRGICDDRTKRCVCENGRGAGSLCEKPGLCRSSSGDDEDCKVGSCDDKQGHCNNCPPGVGGFLCESFIDGMYKRAYDDHHLQHEKAIERCGFDAVDCLQQSIPDRPP